MELSITASTIKLSKKKFLIYNFLFLLIAFFIAMGQNYLKYGASAHYKPMRSITYLIISTLLFIPFLPLATSIANYLLTKLKKYYWIGGALLALITIGLFFLLSNILMSLLGYYEDWVTVKYARSYLGREAIWHVIAILLCIIYVRFSAITQIVHKPKLISGSQGRKKITIPSNIILWIEADDHYLKLHTKDQTLLTRDTLENMAKVLAPDFIRIHRKYLVNQQEILSLEKENRADYVILQNGERLRVGRSYAHQLKSE
ncbi:MAG: LytR/AlgR family response regulator transcription factor [Flammeovirgaceae bacterium]